MNRNLNKEIALMFKNTRDKKIRYGMNKILKYLSKRFKKAESIENELMIFETEIKNCSNIYERRKREGKENKTNTIY